MPDIVIISMGAVRQEKIVSRIPKAWFVSPVTAAMKPVQKVVIVVPIVVIVWLIVATVVGRP